jgi:hypothetical protein
MVMMMERGRSLPISTSRFRTTGRHGITDGSILQREGSNSTASAIFANLEEATAVQVQLKRQDEPHGKLRSRPLISISITIIIIIIITTENFAYQQRRLCRLPSRGEQGPSSFYIRPR